MSTTPTQESSLDQDSIRSQIRTELETTLRKENDVTIALFKDEIRKNNDETFRKRMEQFEEEERKKRKPLTTDELQTLLTKEYTSFTVKIPEGNEIHVFTLKELSQGVERELYKIVKESLTVLAQESGGISLRSIEGDILENIVGLMDVFIPMQDVLVKCCTLCLNPPKGEERKPIFDWLTENWVRDNLSNYRITTIILAQVEVNKMRDFFSILFQGFQSDVTKSLVSAQL